jgi:hypothetical protein
MQCVPVSQYRTAAATRAVNIISKEQQQQLGPALFGTKRSMVMIQEGPCAAAAVQGLYGVAWRYVARDTHFRTPINWKSNEMGRNLSVVPWPVLRTISLLDVRYDTTGGC